MEHIEIRATLLFSSAVFDPHASSRVADFQIVSLKAVATQLLHAMPGFVNSPRPPRVYLPGEIGRKRLVFYSPVTLYASAANPGAMDAAEELSDRFRDGVGRGLMGRPITVITDPPEWMNEGGQRRNTALRGVMNTNFHLPLATLRRQASNNVASPRPALDRSGSSGNGDEDLMRHTTELPGLVARAVGNTASAIGSRVTTTTHAITSKVGEIAPSPLKHAGYAAGSLFGLRSGPTHFILYLNESTWLGEMGDTLASEIRLAQKRKLPIIMIHETSDELGGCELYPRWAPTQD